MKNWTTPEINAIMLESTEALKIDRFGSVRVEDTAVVYSEGSEVVDIPS